MFRWRVAEAFPFTNFRWLGQWLERCPSDSITGIILEGAQT